LDVLFFFTVAINIAAFLLSHFTVAQVICSTVSVTLTALLIAQAEFSQLLTICQTLLLENCCDESSEVFKTQLKFYNRFLSYFSFDFAYCVLHLKA